MSPPPGVSRSLPTGAAAGGMPPITMPSAMQRSMSPGATMPQVRDRGSFGPGPYAAGAGVQTSLPSFGNGTASGQLMGGFSSPASGVSSGRLGGATGGTLSGNYSPNGGRSPYASPQGFQTRSLQDPGSDASLNPSSAGGSLSASAPPHRFGSPQQLHANAATGDMSPTATPATPAPGSAFGAVLLSANGMTSNGGPSMTKQHSAVLTNRPHVGSTFSSATVDASGRDRDAMATEINDLKGQLNSLRKALAEASTTDGSATVSPLLSQRSYLTGRSSPVQAEIREQRRLARSLSPEGYRARSPSRKQDEMDTMWIEVLKRFPHHPEWTLVKEKEGIYRLGGQHGRKVICRISFGGLQVRVGGGWMDASTFLERKGALWMARQDEGISRGGSMRMPVGGSAAVGHDSALIERLLVPTKCWAKRIGVAYNPDIRELRQLRPKK